VHLFVVFKIVFDILLLRIISSWCEKTTSRISQPFLSFFFIFQFYLSIVNYSKHNIDELAMPFFFDENSNVKITVNHAEYGTCKVGLIQREDLTLPVVVILLLDTINVFIYIYIYICFKLAYTTLPTKHISNN